ncbi:MAG: ABC transporter ATP-binding protein [Isosphaeraceae bacterium]
MHADAYARARKLLSDRQGMVVTVSLLGVLQSLLVLKLLFIVGLLTSLITTKGEARYPTNLTAELSDWVTPRVTGTDQGDTLFDDTGLFPIVSGNRDSSNPVHRVGARTLSGVIDRIVTLQNNTGALATLLTVGLGILLVLGLVAQFRRARIAEMSTGAATGLRRQIHRQLYRLGQSSLPTEGVGPVVNLLTREVNDVRDGLFQDLDRRFRSPVLAAGLLASALAISPVLTLFLASLGGLVWLVARVIRRDSRLVADAATRDAAVQLSLLHEDMGMIRTVRVYGMEGIDKARFDEHLERYREADVRRIKTESTVHPTLWLLYGAAAALAVGVFGYGVLASQTIAPASALVMTASLIGLVVPASEWLEMRRSLRQANRSAGGIFEFLDRKPELQQQGGARFLSPLKESIVFEGVTLESRSGRSLLENVSVEIPAGGRTAVVGLDEDAKHAFVCLIPRLIDPKVGRVRIDGQDLREVTLESIRAQVATVLQNDLVFTDSVMMNIGLGDPSFTPHRVIEAAKVAHAHAFIQDLPHGYDTVIGPVGHYLKPDEQYRIALARAFLHDPSIVIIEEPSNTLDDDTKSLVDDTLARLGRNRTLILLPHRLSTIRSCQQIVLLHNGKLDSVGPPRQLQNDSKLFRHIQYVEFNQFATGEMETGQMGELSGPLPQLENAAGSRKPAAGRSGHAEGRPPIDLPQAPPRSRLA